MRHRGGGQILLTISNKQGGVRLKHARVYFENIEGDEYALASGMWKTSSSYCRFEDVQLGDDDLETQFVVGVSTDLSNSRKSVRSKSLSPLVVDTVELNCDNDNE